MEDLAGKVAVVTGAASGIGRATATAFAAEGMKVVLADIDEKNLDASLRSLGDAGYSVAGLSTDVSDGASMEALAAFAESSFGGVDLVHLNAGVAAGGPIWTLSENDWKWVLGVNLWGVIHGVRSFVPRMLAGGGPGHVVATASMAGLISGGIMGPYNVSKHGVVTLAETLLRDLMMMGAPIGVSVLCPGWVNTGIGESGRNRPDALRNAEASGDILGSSTATGGASPLKAVLEGGISPDVVAAEVLDAVKIGRFYILTHAWKDLIKARMDDILEERTPSPMFFPT
jgi:NAD(P)-dependent dehydrogenase (short-subunit alcohol dehydrogenase family)